MTTTHTKATISLAIDLEVGEWIVKRESAQWAITHFEINIYVGPDGAYASPNLFVNLRGVTTKKDGAWSKIQQWPGFSLLFWDAPDAVRDTVYAAWREFPSLADDLGSIIRDGIH